MKAPVDSCGSENWLPIYTVKEKTKLIDLEMFKDHCIAFLKIHGQLHLDIISLVSTSIHSVAVNSLIFKFHFLNISFFQFNL